MLNEPKTQTTVMVLVFLTYLPASGVPRPSHSL